MPDVFDKPDSWVETPQAVSESILLLSHEIQRSRLYAVDCEMVRHHFSTTRLTQPDTVSDRRRQGTDPGLHHRLRVRHCRVRQACQLTQSRHRLARKLSFFLSSSRRMLPPTIYMVGISRQGPNPTPRHSLTPSRPHLHPRRSLPRLRSQSPRICHPLCINTTLACHHSRGRPLKDAHACVDLLRLKVQHGGGFGEFKTDQDLSAWPGRAGGVATAL
jgi:RNA exonuclease 1